MVRWQHSTDYGLWAAWHQSGSDMVRDTQVRRTPTNNSAKEAFILSVSSIRKVNETTAIVETYIHPPRL